MYETFPNDGRERSYGILPIRFTKLSPGQGEDCQQIKIELLTIQHLSTGEFGFPKGHAEPTDADPLTAARRELLEETGISSCKLLFDPYSIYFESHYTNPRTGKGKTTTLWPAEIEGNPEITIQPEEILSFRYVEIEHAHEVLAWKEDHESVQQLVELLKDHIEK